MATAAQNRSTQGLISPPEIVARYGEFRKLLQHRRNTILRHTDEERGNIGGETTPDPADVGDLSVLDMNGDYFMSLADQDRRELLEINDALLRMQRGVYGICENCETPILIQRLEKLPAARFCIECQETIEAKANTARPYANPKL